MLTPKSVLPVGSTLRDEFNTVNKKSGTIVTITAAEVVVFPAASLALAVSE